MAKILLLDIETAPHVATVWGIWQQNIATNQILEPSHTLCWAAKWQGEKTVHFDSIHQSKPKAMVKRIHAMLDECDAVVHYNGKKFDIPTLNKEFLLHGLKPPSPFYQIDLLQTTRGRFRLPSNKLAYVSEFLKLGKKVKHEGHELWLKCMAGDDKAWKTMERYNKQDVILLEKVYKELLPWIKNHPNLNAIDGTVNKCSHCKGNLISAGYRNTQTARYKRWRCVDCGSHCQTVAKVGNNPVDIKGYSI